MKQRVSNVLNRVKRMSWRRLDPASLQFRLTLGIALVTVLGVGGVTTWTIWDMNQTLMNSHQDDLRSVAIYLPPILERSHQISGSTAEIQQAINRLVAYDVLLWVRSGDGTVVAQSMALQMSPIRDRLLAFSSMPDDPKLIKLQGRYMVICGEPVQIKGESIGWIYLAKDITRDYISLIRLSRTLQVTTLVGIVLIILMVMFLVWRSLQPLRQVNQMATTTTGLVRLNPEEMPSEVKALAETCNELLDRLSESGKQHRQFTNDVSHELRTPLCVVYGYLQSMKRRGTNLTPPQQEALDIAASETERTIQLLQSLLDLARANSQSLPFHLEALNLNDVVSEITRMSEKFQHRPIQIQIPSHPVIVKADRNYVQQVLIHLIDNAVSYSEAHTPITITIAQLPEWGVLQVRDHGVGIPLADQPYIFDSFYRVDPSRSRATGGVGLGLSIVKSLVEGMGGQITVHSEPGKGSTFVVKFITG